MLIEYSLPTLREHYLGQYANDLNYRDELMESDVHSPLQEKKRLNLNYLGLQPKLILIIYGRVFITNVPYMSRPMDKIGCDISAFPNHNSLASISGVHVVVLH